MRDHRFRLRHCSAVIPWLVLSRSLSRVDAGSLDSPPSSPRATYKRDRDTIYRIVREKISHGNANARRASLFISARRARLSRVHIGRVLARLLQPLDSLEREFFRTNDADVKLKLDCVLNRESKIRTAGNPLPLPSRNPVTAVVHFRIPRNYRRHSPCVYRKTSLASRDG